MHLEDAIIHSDFQNVKLYILHQFVFLASTMLYDLYNTNMSQGPGPHGSYTECNTYSSSGSVCFVLSVKFGQIWSAIQTIQDYWLHILEKSSLYIYTYIALFFFTMFHFKVTFTFKKYKKRKNMKCMEHRDKYNTVQYRCIFI